MTLEQKAMMLSMACQLMLSENVLSINCYRDGVVEVHMRGGRKQLEQLPGELIVTPRETEKYPFELSKHIGGCKLLAVVEAHSSPCENR